MEHSIGLVLLGASGLALGLCLILVGSIMTRRPITGRQYLPLFFYSVWWYTAGFVFLLQGSVDLADILWRPDFPLHLSYTLMAVILVTLALYSLSYYFIHLYIGPSRLWVPLSVFYVLSAFVLVYLIIQMRPTGLEVEGGRMVLVYADDALFAVLRRVLIVLVIPPLLGLIGYVLLLKMAPTLLQKFRISVTTTILTTLFVSVVGTSFIPSRYLLAWRISVRTVVIVFSLILMYTYHQPPALKNRLESLFYDWTRRRKTAKHPSKDLELSRPRAGHAPDPTADPHPPHAGHGRTST